jgi:hypothetical protein
MNKLTYTFDFEDFEDTDVNGMTQEIDVDNMISEHLKLIQTQLPKALHSVAFEAVKQLWIEKINSVSISDLEKPTEYSHSEPYNRAAEAATDSAVLSAFIASKNRNSLLTAGTEKNKPHFTEPKVNTTKHGSVTRSLLDFVKMAPDGRTYTELNMFYQGKTTETYDSYNDRGGSYIHHHNQLKEPRKRISSGIVEYIWKSQNGKYYYVR